MAKNNWMDWCIDRKYVFARFDYSSYIPVKRCGRTTVCSQRVHRTTVCSQHVHRETEAFSVSLGDRRGVTFSIQWRSYQPEEDGTEPRMLALRMFLWGWNISHGWSHWQWTIIKPKGELQ